MSSPKVSIIVLNWNGKNDTIECLHSIKEISYPNYETIVVDNGSSDGSQDIIRESFPDVRLIESSSNLGFSAGMNLGIEDACARSAEYVFVLNNDTVLHPQIIEELAKACDSHRHVGATVPMVIQYYRPEYLESCGLNITFGPQLCRGRGHGERDRGQYRRREEVEAFSGCGVLLKKSALDKVGRFDPSYFFYIEDLDLSVRLRRAGYTILFVPEAKMWHKESATSGFRPTVFRGKKWGANTIRFMKKHAGLKEWIIFVGKSAFVFPAAFVKQTVRGNIRAFWSKTASALLAIFQSEQ